MRSMRSWQVDWIVGPLLAALIVLLVNALSPGLPLLARIGREAGLAIAVGVPAISSVLDQTALSVWIARGAFVLVTIFLSIVLPRLLRRSLRHGMLATMACAFVLGGISLFVGQEALPGGLLVPALLPAWLLLSVGTVILAGKRLASSRRLGTPLSPRLVGLAQQERGELEQAFETFRSCPVDGQLMDALHALALEFERRGQASRAAAVFRHIAVHRARVPASPNRPDPIGEPPDADAGRRATTLAPSRTIAGYIIEGELGRGAMGVVYRGRDEASGRAVAVKTMVLSDQFEPEQLADARARFFREAQTAKRLTHPNIVTLLDSGEDNGVAYMVMELLSGRDLSAFSHPGALLPIPRVLDILARVADALACAHRANVVHRDVKPANVFYHDDGKESAIQVKVMDFGIARLTDSSRTKTGMVLGSPSYMSPEQLLGKKVDGRSDLFSLGVMLYQMVCGRLPFVGESLGRLMYKITNEPPVDARSIQPEVSDSLARIIDRALSKKVAERYQRAEEMAEALRRCAAEFSALSGNKPPRLDSPGGKTAQGETT